MCQFKYQLVVRECQICPGLVEMLYGSKNLETVYSQYVNYCTCKEINKCELSQGRIYLLSQLGLLQATRIFFSP